MWYSFWSISTYTFQGIHASPSKGARHLVLIVLEYAILRLPCQLFFEVCEPKLFHSALHASRFHLVPKFQDMAQFFPWAHDQYVGVFLPTILFVHGIIEPFSLLEVSGVLGAIGGLDMCFLWGMSCFDKLGTNKFWFDIYRKWKGSILLHDFKLNIAYIKNLCIDCMEIFIGA